MATADESAILVRDIVARVSGLEVRVCDTDGRQGAVDLQIMQEDGRESFGEVTRVALQNGMRQESILGKADFTWPSAGSWWWSIEVYPGVDLRELRKRYASIIRTCEGRGGQRPDQLPGAVRDADPDLSWLNMQDASFFGHADLSTLREDGSDRGVMITPAGSGGAGDKTLDGLPAVLDEAYMRPHIERRIRKLATAGGVEGHLFLIVDDDAVPFSVFYGLAWGDSLPAEAPPMPPGVTDIWIAPRWSRRVLRYSSSDGWSTSAIRQLTEPSPARVGAVVLSAAAIIK